MSGAAGFVVAGGETFGFVVVGNEMKYRAWREPRGCSHDNGNICATCDHDRYYASTYPNVPWAAITAPQAH